MNMLGTKTKPKSEVKLSSSTNGSPAIGETCVVSNGTIIDGQFKASENVRLDGLIKGEVKCDKRLVIGEKGRIEGTLNTQDGIIMGTIEGEVKVHGTLTLKSTALIKGKIRAKFMEVDEGARYIGECSIGG